MPTEVAHIADLCIMDIWTYLKMTDFSLTMKWCFTSRHREMFFIIGHWLIYDLFYACLRGRTGPNIFPASLTTAESFEQRKVKVHPTKDTYKVWI